MEYGNELFKSIHSFASRVKLVFANNESSLKNKRIFNPIMKCSYIISI